jgi:hypothetical protein
MNAAEVLSALTAHDATVVVEGERIRVLHPVGNPPPFELIEIARGQKEALRTILAGREGVSAELPYGATLAALRAACPDFIEADRWQLNQFQGRNVFDLRTWYTADGRLKPGKGFAAEVRHLPRLAAAIAKAEAKARELGLVGDEGAGDE